MDAAELPPWAVEVALTIERPARHDQGAATADSTEAVLLLKAPSRFGALGGAAEAAREVEATMGLRTIPATRLLMGEALPGLTPIAPAAAMAHLGATGTRGLPAPLRRRHPTVGMTQATWRASAGSVLTCEGPLGVSAQAVVALGSPGKVGAITPPPGGALVLRAWRTTRTWGLACGLVLGAAEALGLGREAGRRAARMRAEGWDAAVLNGLAALQLARAGNPGDPVPEAAAHAASGAQVAAVAGACLSAGGLDQQWTSSRWTLSVTP